MDILLLTDTPQDGIETHLKKQGCTVELLPLNTPLEKPYENTILVGSTQNAPPSPLDPEKQSVLFIDDTFIEHPATCYACSKQWAQDLLPLILSFFEKDTQNDPLSRSYQRTLYRELQTLLELLKQATEAPSKEGIETLIHHIHTLQESAPPTSFKELSQICAAFENDVREFSIQFSKDPKIPYPREKKEDFLCHIFDTLKNNVMQPAPKKQNAQISSPDLFLVDDDRAILELIGLEAKRRGIIFHGETSFEKAKELLLSDGFSPKIALFDIFTPDESLSGYDLVRIVRETKKESLTMILGIISAKGELAERMEATKLDIDVYFEKPIDISFLLDQIEKMAQPHYEKKVKVLLVDDDETFCKLVGLSLEKRGFQFTALPSGKEFFPTVHKIHPDIILVDISLPDQNGIELVHSLKMDPRFRNMYVIMVTASTNSEDIKKSYEAGALDFMSKPLDFENLPSYLYRFLRKKEYLEFVYKKDPDYGLYTNRSLSDFFTVSSFRYRSFPVVFFYILNEDGSVGISDRTTTEQYAKKLLSFFSASDIIGVFNGVLTLEIVNYTLEQSRIMVEAVHEAFQQDTHFQKGKQSFISIVMRFPLDGKSLEELYEKSQHILQEQKQFLPWSIISSLAKEEKSRTVERKNVILISSDLQLRTIITNAFQMRDIVVSSYKSGKEGYTFLLNHFFHERNSAVIFDGDLEKENGHVLLQKIKNVVGQRTPLYFLTNLSKEEDLTEGYTLGATRIFSKPIQLQVLIDSLERDIEG